MIKIKKLIIPTILIITILVSGFAFAQGDDEKSNKNFIERFLEKKLNLKEKREERKIKPEEKKHKKYKIRQEKSKRCNELIDEADSIVDGIEEQWEELINERRELKNQIKEKLKEKHEANKNLNVKRNQLKDKLNAEITAIKEKAKNGKITEEEAEKLIKEKVQSFREKFMEITPNKGTDKFIIIKNYNNERNQLWSEFKIAVESKDNEKVSEKFKKLYDFESKVNDYLKDVLKDLK